MANGNTIFLPRNQTTLEALGQGLQLGLPGLVAGGKQRALQQFAQQQGLGNIPFGTPPELIAALLSQGGADPFTLGPGQQRFSPSGQPIASIPPLPPAGGAGFTLTPGGARFEPGGQQIASLPPLPPRPLAPRAPTAFEQTQNQIDALSAKKRAGAATETDLARLAQLLGQKPSTASDIRDEIREISKAVADGELSKEEGIAQIKQLQKLNRTIKLPEFKPGGDPNKQVNTLRKEFNADPIVKNQEIVSTQLGIIEQAFDQATNPLTSTESRIASDQALVISFNKMLDPTSVVRESEFARTPLQAAILSRFLSQPAKAAKGGLAITDADRKAILDMARRAADVTSRRFNRTFDRFSNLAASFGVDPNKIFGGITKPLSANEEAEYQKLLLESNQ